MCYNEEIKNKIEDILNDIELLRKGKRTVNGETVVLTNPTLLFECIENKEAELGRMVIRQFKKENHDS